MLEAVGHAGLQPFFTACDKALQPGGRAMIQVITIPDRKYNAYRYSSDWIRKHIFPGGHVPSVGAITKAMASGSTLHLDKLEQHGQDYAETLDRWRQTLLARRQKILDLGYDEAFLRKWEYYFAYCQAGFSSNIIDLAQMVLTKPEHS
jgi:cyclopropane-fatty-acyl-phospholipid synthase